MSSLSSTASFRLRFFPDVLSLCGVFFCLRSEMSKQSAKYDENLNKKKWTSNIACALQWARNGRSNEIKSIVLLRPFHHMVQLFTSLSLAGTHFYEIFVSVYGRWKFSISCRLEVTSLASSQFRKFEFIFPISVQVQHSSSCSINVRNRMDQWKKANDCFRCVHLTDKFFVDVGQSWKIIEWF